MIEITEVPSPFCGVGTDDLVVQVDGLAVNVVANGCAVNTPAFEQPITDINPRISGKTASLAEAAQAAAKLLTNTNQPVIGGCATDVNGMRALLSLAERIGAVADKSTFNIARRNMLVLQDSGWMTTTLAEVKNRCDVLLIVGTDLETISPRFFERYLWTDAMFLEDSAEREIIYLGHKPSGKASHSPKGKAPQVYTCADSDLPAIVSVLRALVKGSNIQADKVGGIAVSELLAIADKLKRAKYGVVTWAAGALDFAHAELTVQSLTEMVKEINMMNTRCSALPLAAKDGGYTANQVCGWTTGYPVRINFNRGYPDYDPYLFDTQRMVSDGEADVLLWVNAFNTKSKPPVSNIPTVVIGRSGMTFDKEPEVFIPIGTPGIDHAGHAFRTDSVVAIRLQKLRDSGLPSTAVVLSAIEQAYTEQVSAYASIQVSIKAQ